MAQTRRSETYIGKSVPRHEDRDLLVGNARFLDDIDPEGTLHARFVRSTVAHGRIQAVIVDAARKAPGVFEVFTADDVSIGPQIPPVHHPDVTNVPRPALAGTRVRFAGEAIAVILAESPYAAEDAAELVDVDIEELPILTDARSALKPDAPLLHDQSSNLLLDRRHEHGDVDQVLASAPVRFERTICNNRVSAVPMECRGLLAVPDGTGLHVYAPTQVPNRLADVITDLLSLEAGQVRVSTTDVGGSFGQKAQVHPEELVVAWAAMTTQRPVKWVEDRTENLTSATHARGQEVTVRVGADEDGRVLAIDAEVLSDVGAYGMESHGPLVEAGITPTMIPGPYRVENYRFHSRAVCTNKCPQGAYRGVGSTMAVLVHERIMDILAVECGMDPADIRRINLIPSTQLPYRASTGRTYDSGDYERALETCLRLIDYDGFAERRAEAAARGRIAGIGLASFVEYTSVNRKEYLARGMMGTRGDDSARVALDDNGIAHVWTTLPAIGQGSKTTFAQIAADALNTTPDRVVVERCDTSLPGMVGSGVGASRSMVSGGGAVWKAARRVHEAILSDASEKLGVAPEQLSLDQGSVWESVDEGDVAEPVLTVLDLIAQHDDAHYEATEQFDPPEVVYSYATHAACVEIDPVTGRVEVTDYAVSDDCGQVINPLIVEGQIRGGVVQGIGVALYEQHHYDVNGQLATASFMDYLVPLATDVGRIKIESFSIPSPVSLLGTKGVGESGALAPPAAVANAVGNALGVEINEVPIRADKVRRILREREAGASC